MVSAKFIIGGTNKFVDVNFESADTVLCNFLQHNSSTSQPYTCKIEYGHCEQQLNTTVEGYALAKFPSIVRIDLLPNLQRWECYIITASNGSYTVLLKGSFSKCHNYYVLTNNIIYTNTTIIKIIIITIMHYD